MDTAQAVHPVGSLPSDDNAQIQDSFSDSFSEDIFDALGAKDIPDEEKATLLVQMIEIVQVRVFDQVLDRLNDAECAELKQLMENEDVEAVERFLLEHLPDYGQIFEQEAKKLRRELVGRLVVKE